MLTDQRKSLILDVLRRDGEVIAKRLSQDLGLSEDTIRRDLRELAAEGKLQRVHGGALPASPATAPLANRRSVAPDDKAAIGRHAAGMIEAGQIIILDGGTTTVQLARALPYSLAATIVTHSPAIAVELIDHTGIEVILLGGRLFRHSMVSVGAATVDAISRLRADVYFMGVTGIHEEVGLSTGDFEEAAVKRALMRASGETVVLASPEKLGAASPHVVAPLSDASAIVTVKSVAEDVTEPLARSRVPIIRV